MSKWKYTGPDRELPGFGKVGHTSVIEATGAQIAEFGPTFFEKVGDKEIQTIVPFGTVPFVPDVTGLTREETAVADAKARKEARDAEDKLNPPTPEVIAARKRADDLAAAEAKKGPAQSRENKRLEDDQIEARRKAALAHTTGLGHSTEATHESTSQTHAAAPAKESHPSKLKS